MVKVKEVRMEGAIYPEEKEKEGGNCIMCSVIANRWVCLEHRAGSEAWPG